MEVTNHSLLSVTSARLDFSITAHTKNMLEDNQMKSSKIHVEDASQSYNGFTRPEMDAIRRAANPDNNIDESTSSMALTEIK